MFLYLDTSSDQGLITLAASEGIVEEVSFQAGKRGGGDLLPLVKSLLDAHRVKVANLEAIIVGVGPGSFTGIRVAVSVAQGFSLPFDIPLIPISSLLFFKPDVQSDYLVVHNARRGDVYTLIARLGRDGKIKYEKPYVSGIECLANDKGLPKLWVSPSHLSIEAELPNESSVSICTVKPSARHLLDYIHDIVSKKEFVSSLPLPLQYLRGVVLPKSDAST